jgi:hypothetical protein
MGPHIIHLNSAVPAISPATVERYVALYWKVQNHLPVQQEFEKLRAQIGAAFDPHPAEQDALAEGIEWNLSITKKREESTWRSRLVLWRKLGGLKALDLWNVTQKAVVEALGEKVKDSLVIKTRTGYRQIRPVKRETARIAA